MNNLLEAAELVGMNTQPYVTAGEGVDMSDYRMVHKTSLERLEAARLQTMETPLEIYG